MTSIPDERRVCCYAKLSAVAGWARQPILASSRPIWFSAFVENMCIITYLHDDFLLGGAIDFVLNDSYCILFAASRSASSSPVSILPEPSASMCFAVYSKASSAAFWISSNLHSSSYYSTQNFSGVDVASNTFI